MPQNGRYVLEPETVKLLADYRIPYPEYGVAIDADEAVRISEQVGYPVVLKVVSPDVVHKSDAGGVLVGLESASAVRRGFSAMMERVKSVVKDAAIKGVLVARQADPGLEVIIGGLNDATFGPTVMFGLGGIFAEVLRDVSFGVAPLQRCDAEEMIREIRGYPLLIGERGQASRDVEALIELLLAVSRFLCEQRDVEELDLNPVRLYEQGLMVLDARMIVKSE